MYLNAEYLNPIIGKCSGDSDQGKIERLLYTYDANGLINLSKNTVIFPDKQRRAIVHPIYKNRNALDQRCQSQEHLQPGTRDRVRQ